MLIRLAAIGNDIAGNSNGMQQQHHIDTRSLPPLATVLPPQSAKNKHKHKVKKNTTLKKKSKKLKKIQANEK